MYVILYQFEATGRYSDEYPVPALRIHASDGWGCGYRDLGAILEPDSETPGFLLNQPISVNLVGPILELLLQRIDCQQNVKRA